MRHQFSKDDGKFYDVVCISTDDGSELWRETRKRLPDAEAVQLMAIMRQGLADRFFKIEETPEKRTKGAER